MASITKNSIIRFLLLLAFPFFLMSCAEVRTLISILFNGANTLSTSAFEFDEIRSGTHTTCAILGDKTVRCAGGGALGSLGIYNSAPAEIIGEVKAVSAGHEFTCAIVGANSQLFCFGKNNRGQLGNKLLGNSVEAVPVLDPEGTHRPLQDVKAVATGDAHACALLKTGRVVCWGDNSAGQTGNPRPELIEPHSIWESEKNPKTLMGIHQVSAKGNSTCVVARDDHTVFCFGERFGIKKQINWAPERIEITNSLLGLSDIKSLGVGRGFGCALAKNSQVYCWGNNDFNQLGISINTSGSLKAGLVQVSYPQEMPISHIEEIAVGERHVCAIQRDEKSVFCWGDNRYGQLGNTSVRGNPEQVALGSNNLTLKGVKTLAVGSDRTCIISLIDELYCWGNGAHGRLGNDKVFSQYPIRALDATGEILGNAAQVSVGWDHTCMLDLAQKLYCFGLNSFGQLGFKMFAGTAILADQKPIQKITALDSYEDKTCVIHGVDQGVSCFGGREIDIINKKPERNSFIAEKLKNGNQLFKNILGVALGKNHVCLIEPNAGVSCVQFADAMNAKIYNVILDSNQHPLKDVWQMRTHDEFNCALTQEKGEIWCWGKWKGDTWPMAKRLPVLGKTTSEFIQLVLNQDQVCGVRGLDRSVYCTKISELLLERLQLEPVFTSENQPLQNIIMVSGGARHFCANNSDGKLFCWGKNESGQLGQRNKSEVPNPIQISLKNPTLAKISRISAGDRYTCVVGTHEPSLFCFGESLLGGENSWEPVEYPL